MPTSPAAEAYLEILSGSSFVGGISRGFPLSKVYLEDESLLADSCLLSWGKNALPGGLQKFQMQV